jgi:hypothetical protein
MLLFAGRECFQMTTAHNHRGPHIALESSWLSDVTAISPFAGKLMRLLSNCGCVPEGVSNVEIALQEAPANPSFAEIMRILA